MRVVGPNLDVGGVTLGAGAFRGTDRFFLLYLGCLGSCLGILHVLGARAEARPPPLPPPQEVAVVGEDRM